MLRVFSLLLIALVCVSAKAGVDTSVWPIQRAVWTDSDEKEYSQFIQILGHSNCHRVDECLKIKENPYRVSDPPGIQYGSDCADLPYTFRAYFAWKKHLPFSYVSAVDPIGGGTDNRYSVNGNQIDKRRDLVWDPTKPVAFTRLVKQMQDTVSTAMFRVPPMTDVNGRIFSDFYPVSISRGAIHPGTVYYDPSGHVITIYEIAPNGIMRYIDAHPDNSVTRGQFGEKFGRSRAAHGAGFKNFRPLKLVGATADAQGNLVGGQIAGAKNGDLKDYSLEEFYGNSPNPKGAPTNDKKFYIGSQDYSFWEYTRIKMAGAGLKYNPMNELQTMMGALCDDFKDRVRSVEDAVTNRVSTMNHPDALPNNIYGANDNTWESYSTPSRDARLKTSAVELRKTIEELVNRYQKRDALIDYKGNDLPGDLLKAYEAGAAACSISYTNSAGQAVTLGYKQLIERMFKISFDPYNCAELRWGATGAEAQSCRDDANKTQWYSAEQRLRNQIDRDYAAVMNFRLQDLINKVQGSGTDKAPDINLEAYLRQLAGVAATRASR